MSEKETTVEEKVKSEFLNHIDTITTITNDMKKELNDFNSSINTSTKLPMDDLDKFLTSIEYDCKWLRETMSILQELNTFLPKDDPHRLVDILIGKMMIENKLIHISLIRLLRYQYRKIDH